MTATEATMPTLSEHARWLYSAYEKRFGNPANQPQKEESPVTTTSPLTDLLAHPELCALRAAICADPVEDTPRLVLADWLEERGEEEWSELIRAGLSIASTGDDIIQCSCSRELPKHDANCPWAICYQEVNRRYALRASLEPTLRRGVRCGRCREGRIPAKVAAGGLEREPLRATRARDCPTCHGRGFLGTLGESPRADVDAESADPVPGLWIIPARWSRGFISGITCTLEWWMQNGKRCVAEWPLTTLELRDYNDHIVQRESGWIIIASGAPFNVYKLLHRTTHPTEADARAALSAALLIWARS